MWTYIFYVKKLEFLYNDFESICVHILYLCGQVSIIMFPNLNFYVYVQFRATNIKTNIVNYNYRNWLETIDFLKL